MNAMAPPGWYGDPENPDMIRYWDGAQWTDHRSPSPGRIPTHQVDGRLPDVGTWLSGMFSDIWVRRNELLGLLLVAIVPSLVIGWSVVWTFGGVVWADGEWTGFSGSRFAVLVLVALLSALLAVAIYLAVVHQMYRFGHGADPSVGESLAAGVRLTPRAVGWSIVLSAAVISGLLVVFVVGAIVGTAMVALLMLALMPLSIWLWVRFSFFLIAVVAPGPERNPLASSAAVSHSGRFWAVLGRLLVLGLLGSGLSWALTIPLAVVGGGTVQSIDEIIVQDASDELVFFDFGALLEQAGFGGGAALVVTAVVQAANMVLLATGTTALYSSVRGSGES